MNSNKTKFQESFLREADTLLRHAELRVTQARINVLACLLAAGETLSHGELHAALPDMDRVTLYRALDALVEAELAHKITTHDRAFRYGSGPARHQDNQADHQHGHFKCTGCGRVFCLTPTTKKRSLLDQLQKSLKHSMEPGFQSHDIELVIKGWCADCAD